MRDGHARCTPIACCHRCKRSRTRITATVARRPTVLQRGDRLCWIDELMKFHVTYPTMRDMFGSAPIWFDGGEGNNNQEESGFYSSGGYMDDWSTCGNGTCAEHCETPAPACPRPRAHTHTHTHTRTCCRAPSGTAPLHALWRQRRTRLRT